MCFIPVKTFIEGGSNKVSLTGRPWQRMLVANRQPEFVNPEHMELARKRVLDREAVQKACMKTITDRLHNQNKGDELVMSDLSDLSGLSDLEEEA